MGKKKRNKATVPQQKPGGVSTDWSGQLEFRRSILIFFGGLFLFLILFYKPLALDGMDTGGSDIVSGLGKVHQIKLYQEKTGRRALWNPAMFAGMPIYHRYGMVVWSVDLLLNRLDPVLDWRIWFFLAGALGMFLLARFLGLSAVAGMAAALGFILMPHFQALIAVGHFSKFRALMWMPYVALTFLYLLRKPELLSALLFALALSLQMRTQHYQIIFYTLLLLLFFGVAELFRLLKEKSGKTIGKILGFLVLSFILTLAVIAHPFFAIKDYTPYSTRGGNAVDIHSQGPAKDARGVGFDYATQWSYSLSEFWNLIVPRFHGGTSRETYTGKAVPQLRNRQIPAYWGSMPFTQSYEYVGILLAFLAICALFLRWNRWEVKTLFWLAILALLLALGRHFAGFYKLFFYYLPYFDKFRVPMMILTLIMFIVTLLAAFGLDALLELLRGKTGGNSLKKIYAIWGGLAGVLVVLYFLSSSFSLAQPQEAGQYGAQVMEMLRRIRLEILQDSLLRTLLFLILGGALLFSGLKKWIGPGAAVTGMVLLIALDTGIISHNYLNGKYVDLKQVEAATYRDTAIDPVMKNDSTLFRVAPPVRQIANDSRWCYNYQSIGGYAADKMQLIQDIIANNWLAASAPGRPFNLNILSMLNGKYIITRQALNAAALVLRGRDDARKLYLYENLAVLPRAFFADSIRVFSDPVKRLKFMNSSEFTPGSLALLEEQPAQTFSAPDSARAKVRNYSPDHFSIEVYTDKPALLVISEVYYPKGWQARLEDGSPLKIYKTDHLLRSVIVPAGNHTVTMDFHPRSYFLGTRISLAGTSLLYLGILALGYREWKDKFRQWSGKKPNDK